MGDANEVTRRDILTGLGAAGVGVGAASVGSRATSALLTDSEGFTGNVFTVGELDLDVEYDVRYQPSNGPMRGDSGTVNGSDDSGIDIDTLEPGDRGRLDLCPRPASGSNPAYLWLCGGVTGYRDGPPAKTPPENLTVPATDRNLGEAIQARLRYVPPSDTGRLWCPDADDDDDGVLLAGSFVDVLSQVAAGIPLDPTGVPGLSAGDQSCFHPETGGPCLRLEWCVPASAGNAIQGDGLAFDLVFHARQCRHSDGTGNPCESETDADHAISFISFCTSDGTNEFDVEFSWSDEDTDEDGDLTSVDWSLVSDDVDVDTVVLYYATTFENFYYDSSSPTSGTATVGEGDEVFDWPPGGTTVSGQAPSDPCPDGQRGIKYDWLHVEEEFERDDD